MPGWLTVLMLGAGLFAATVRAQDAPAYPPEIEGAAVEVYKTVGDVDLKVWIIKPEGVSGPRPAVVFFFGGGWAQGTPLQFERQARAAANRGMYGILADYRVSSRHGTKGEASVEDARSAIRWVRGNAERLGIDPDRIGAAGGSAGGHLAASAAVLSEFDADRDDSSISPVPNALVLFNPALMLAPVEEAFQPTDAVKDRFSVDLERVSPFHHVKAGLPPTLVIHGTRDRVVPLTTVMAYCEKAVAAGNRCDLALYPGVDHGFFNAQPYYFITQGQMLLFLSSLGWYGR
jgi:acetyl esterase/lipase